MTNEQRMMKNDSNRRRRERMPGRRTQMGGLTFEDICTYQNWMSLAVLSEFDGLRLCR